MPIAFLANCHNGSILSPISCSTRNGNTIISYLLEPINQASLSQVIAFHSFQLLLLANPNQLPPHLYILATMSSKKSKVTTTKQGVKVMNLSGSSPASSPDLSSAIVKHQEILDIQPLLHAPPLDVQPDFPKKEFKKKSRHSSRLPSSTKSKGTSSSAAPIVIPDEPDVHVEKVITKVVESILQEDVSNVTPDVPTSGTSGVEPIVQQPESESEESTESAESEKEDDQEGTADVPSKSKDHPKVSESSSEEESEDEEESEGEEEDTQPVQDNVPTILVHVPFTETATSGESDDILITKTLIGAVAARLTRQKTKVKPLDEVKTPSSNPTSSKKVKTTPVTYKSRQVSVEPSTKKKTFRKMTVAVKRKRTESSSDEDHDVGQDVLDIVPPSQKRKM